MTDRFEFGKNWSDFLDKLDTQRIEDAENSLRKALGDHLAGATFLDIGSGSGLFSLAARNLGAKVTSFDYDEHSVQCTSRLRKRFHADDENWNVFQGSALDEAMMESLGTFDVVYSWGVLHHTGAMWKALDMAASRVAPGGRLFISIYNDQGGKSLRWKAFKKRFINAPPWAQHTMCAAHIAYWELRLFLIRLVRGQNPFASYKNRKQGRGMDVWHDTKDWLGGYPFEVAKPEEIFNFHRNRGFSLTSMTTCGGGHGCNEFIFIKSPVTGDMVAPCAE